MGSWPNHHLERLPFVHRAVAVGNPIEVHGPIEDPARLDRSIEDVGQQLLDISPGGRGAATDSDVAVEGGLRSGHRLALGYADTADGAARADDFDRGLGRLVAADALEDRVGAETAGELAHLLHRLLAPLGDDLIGAELTVEIGSLSVAAENDDLLGAWPPGGDHAAQ